MRSMTAAACCAALLLPCLAPPARAADPGRPAKDTVRYLQFTEGELRGQAVAIDAVVKGVLQGRKVASGEADVCFPISNAAQRLDRIRVPLTLQGNVLSGSGVTQVDGAKVTVSLHITEKDDQVTVSGEVQGAPGGPVTLQAEGLEYSEDDPRQPAGTDPADEDHTLDAPNALSIELDPRNTAALLPILRAHRVQVDQPSLTAACDDWRNGTQSVAVLVSPDRLGALVAQLKAMPGFKSARPRASGELSVTNAVRFSPAPDLLKNGQIDQARLTALLSETAAKAMAATATEPASRDEHTGETALELKRPSDGFKGDDLARSVDVRWLVQADPRDASKQIVYVGFVDTRLSDPAGDNGIAFTEPSGESEDNTGGTLLASFLSELARVLKGERWDEDAARWGN